MAIGRVIDQIPINETTNRLLAESSHEHGSGWNLIPSSNTIVKRWSCDALLDILHSLLRVINEDSNRSRIAVNYTRKIPRTLAILVDYCIKIYNQREKYELL